MILPDFILQTRQNKVWKYSGTDSPKWCYNKKHFNNYPYKVSYNYNSRGFRDTEWPDNIEDLKKAIWCVGDSFTVGLGAPIEHCWVNVLQQKIKRRCNNISLDGGSNDWILRKTKRIIEEVNPEIIIIHWSYIWRGEHTDISLQDEDRRLKDKGYKHNIQYFKDFLTILNNIDTFNTTKIIQSIIPDPAMDISAIEECIQDVLNDYPNDHPGKANILMLYEKILDYVQSNFVYCRQCDLARDAHHYDILTTTNFVSNIIKLL